MPADSHRVNEGRPEPVGPGLAQSAETDPGTTIGTCNFCKLPIDLNAKVCPNCQQWQRPKGRTAEQRLSLFGGLTGALSTFVLVGTYAWDWVWPPRPNFVVSENPACRKTGVTVEVKNTGRGYGFLPTTATEIMSIDPELSESLSLAEPVRVAPDELVQAEYKTAAKSEIQPGVGNCERKVHIGKLNVVKCASCSL